MKKMPFRKSSHSSSKDPAVSRRSFLLGAGALSGLAITGPFAHQAQTRTPKFSADPFNLGVASGDPMPEGVVLWTRLAPDPLNGGGMPPAPVAVSWEVAEDEQLKKIIKRGQAVASPRFGHSVHVEVRGLKPAHWYWYRFMTGS